MIFIVVVPFSFSFSVIFLHGAVLFLFFFFALWFVGCGLCLWVVVDWVVLEWGGMGLDDISLCP